MKKSILLIAIAALSIAACNKNDHRSAKGQNGNADTMAGQLADTSISINSPKNGISIKDIIDLYLQMKNALAGDNSKDAAEAGKALVNSFHNFNKDALSDSQKKII